MNASKIQDIIVFFAFVFFCDKLVIFKEILMILVTKLLSHGEVFSIAFNQNPHEIIFKNI